MAQIPHLNDLYEKFKGKGLVVVGVASDSEGKSKMEQFISSKGIKYPITLDTKALVTYGVQGIPDSVLVGANGKVLWTGHPSGLKESAIEAGLKGVIPPFPQALARFNPLLRARKVGKAYLDVQKAIKDGKAKEAEAKPTLTAIEDRMKDLLAEGEKAAGEKDFFSAGRSLNELKLVFAGTDPAKKAADKMKELEKDSKARDQMKAAETLDKLDLAVEGKAFVEAYRGYKGLVKKFPGTTIEKLATEKITQIEKDKLLNYRSNCPACKRDGRTCSQHRDV